MPASDDGSSDATVRGERITFLFPHHDTQRVQPARPNSCLSCRARSLKNTGRRAVGASQLRLDELVDAVFRRLQCFLPGEVPCRAREGDSPGRG